MPSGGGDLVSCLNWIGPLHSACGAEIIQRSAVFILGSDAVESPVSWALDSGVENGPDGGENLRPWQASGVLAQGKKQGDFLAG
jgi:hypothetical protein